MLSGYCLEQAPGFHIHLQTRSEDTHPHTQIYIYIFLFCRLDLLPRLHLFKIEKKILRFVQNIQSHNPFTCSDSYVSGLYRIKHTVMLFTAYRSISAFFHLFTVFVANAIIEVPVSLDILTVKDVG